jgi:23S rRNA maturation mini-RNase III
MEALFAFLYLNGREERMEELFRIGYDLLEKSDDAD